MHPGADPLGPARCRRVPRRHGVHRYSGDDAGAAITGSPGRRAARSSGSSTPGAAGSQSPDGAVREFRFTPLRRGQQDKRDEGDAGKRGKARGRDRRLRGGVRRPGPVASTLGRAVPAPARRASRCPAGTRRGGRPGRTASPSFCSTARPRRQRSCMRSTRDDQVRTIKPSAGRPSQVTECAGCKLNTACDDASADPRACWESLTRRPRSAPGRSRTAGPTGVPGTGPPSPAAPPEAERVQRERRARAGRPCLAGGEPPRPAACRLHGPGHPAPAPMTGPPGGGMSQGRRPRRGSADARQPRRAVPLHAGPARSPRSAWSRRSRSTTPTRTSSSSPSPTCSTWRTGPGSGARSRPGQQPAATGDGPAPASSRSSRSRTVLLARERARRASRTALASSWSCSPPTPATCPAHRPERPGPGRHGPRGHPRARRPLAFGQDGCPARPGTALPVTAQSGRWCPDAQSGRRQA